MSVPAWVTIAWLVCPGARPSPGRTQSSPIIHDGFVYLIDDNVSYCFDATNGSQRWQEPTQATITSPILADGKIFVLDIEQAVRIRTGETDTGAL